MGAKVGIFDADVYGPSLPTMVSPEVRVLQMNPNTRQIVPTEFEGVKLVSFGFAGQGSAIMRGPMVSGVRLAPSDVHPQLETTGLMKGTLAWSVAGMPFSRSSSDPKPDVPYCASLSVLLSDCISLRQSLGNDYEAWCRQRYSVLSPIAGAHV